MAKSFRLGYYKAECAICGFEFYNDELQKNWKGQYVDKRCFEPRHPQDFVRGKPDPQALPWTQPASPDTFVTTPVKPSDL